MTSRSGYGVPTQWLPFIGSKLGIAKGLHHLAADPDDLEVHHVFPSVTSLGRLLKHQHALDPRAGGAGITLPQAINCAMGELLERYASFAYDWTDQIFLSYSELVERGFRSVPIEKLCQFSFDQFRSERFPYSEFTEATRVGWLAGTNLLDGLLTYLPGQLVALGYRRSPQETDSCFYSTSSGCALGTSVEEALSRGLLEVIERDAVMIRWYARLPPPLLDLDPVKLWGDDLESRKLKLEISFHDLTIDGDIPVVGVTCVERTGRPCFFILSAASALDVSTAARKALVEAGQGRPFIKSMAGTSEAPVESTTFDDFNLNLRFYAEPTNARYVEWFLRNRNLSTRKFPTALNCGTSAEALRYLLDRCDAMAVTPIAFDMTTPELLDAGLFACRVVVPELVPLCVPSAPFFGHARLAHFMSCHKHKSSARDIPDWLPHPFP